MLKRITGTSMYKTDFHMYFKNLIVRSSNNSRFLIKVMVTSF